MHFLQASSSLGRFLLLTIWVLQVIFGLRGPKCPVECEGLRQKPGGQGELWMEWGWREEVCADKKVIYA